MKYTFEITVSGCSTKCKHCYVSGGPGINISFSDYIICIEKMAKVFEYFQGNDISLTLGNEKLERTVAKFLPFSMKIIAIHLCLHCTEMKTIIMKSYRETMLLLSLINSAFS